MTQVEASAAATYRSLLRHTNGALAVSQRRVGRGAVEVAAEGCHVRLSDGRSLLDFGGYGVSFFGHRHPAIVAAVAEQLGVLTTSTRLVANTVTATFVDELKASVARSDLTRIWLGLNGSDVVELALKLAARVAGRPRMLCLERSFHGKTMAALSVSASRNDEIPGYRRPTAIAPTLESLERELAVGDVAALIFEPIQGEGGVHEVDLAFLASASDALHAAGAFFISDEIQVGFGRCGPISIAVEYGLECDAVLFGKALGGGVLPLAALIASASLFQPATKDAWFHTTTFSGHPLCVAAGLAALRVLPSLRELVPAIDSRVGNALARVRLSSPDVCDVRGRGALWGIELRDAAIAARTVADLADAGLLVSPCVAAPAVLRLFPPACASDDEIDTAMEIMFDVLSAASAAGRGRRVKEEVDDVGS